jgi:hypothetical protein
MKKYIILALLLLPVLAFSQMQNIISQGNTATTQRRILNSSIDSSLIKIRSENTTNLITSLPYLNGSATVFCKTTNGTVLLEETTLSNLKVYDFQVLNGDIYFCGSSSNGSFIAWTSVNNMFSVNPQPIKLQIICGVIKPFAVKELELYKWDDGIHVAALADDIYLIDMNTANPSTYQIIQQNTTNRFRALSVGKDKIVTIESVNDTSIVVTAFDAGNISQYTYQGYTHPELRYDKYVIENSMTNSDIFTFAYTHRLVTNNTWYKTDFATIDVSNTINVINKQCLEVSEAKLEPIDLEFCIEDNTLLYLTNGHQGYDEIFQIDHLMNIPCISISIQPLSLVSEKIKQYNSIIRYDNYYFAAVANNLNLNGVIIFDCFRNSNSHLQCAKDFTEVLQNYNYLNNVSLTPNYINIQGNQNTVIINAVNNNGKYIPICQ